MRRTLLALMIVAAGGMCLAHHDEHGKGGVKVLSQKDITEKVDGKKAMATTVEVTLEPGEVETAHRHPGPGFGYVIEGEYEWAIDDNKATILKAGYAQSLHTDNAKEAETLRGGIEERLMRLNQNLVELRPGADLVD